MEEIREICVRPAKRYDVSRPRHTTTVGSVDGLMRCFNFTVLCPGSWILDQRQRSAGDSGPSTTPWLCTFRRAPSLRGGRRHCPYSTDGIRMVATSASHVGVPITMCTTGRRRRMLDGRRRTPTNHAHERRVRAHVLGARTRADVALYVASCAVRSCTCDAHAASAPAPATTRSVIHRC